jgi:hypothetical protein
MMIPLHVFHASQFSGDNFTYRRPHTYQPKDTSIIFSQYIREKVSNQFGLDIHNCLYAYSYINEYANYNFGNNTFAVSSKNLPCRAFVCEGVSDITYNLKTGSGTLLCHISGFIESICCGQAGLDDFITEENKKYLNEDGTDFLSYEAFKSFLSNVHDAFHKEAGTYEYGSLYDEAMTFVNHVFDKIDRNYLPNIKEVSLPYSGTEEIMIVAEELFLEKVFIALNNNETENKVHTDYQPIDIEDNVSHEEEHFFFDVA